MEEEFIDPKKLFEVLRLVQSLEDNAADAIFLLLAAVKTLDLHNRKANAITPLNEIVVDMLNSLEGVVLQ